MATATSEKLVLNEITLCSSVTKIRSLYPKISEVEVQRLQDLFKSADQEGKGVLEQAEVKYLLEKQGRAKTHQELRQLLAKMEVEGNASLNFHQFLHAMLGNPPLPMEEDKRPRLAGKIYSSSLAQNARFFEDKMFKSRDQTEDNKVAIEKEAAFRRAEKEEQRRKQEEEERVRKEREAKKAAMRERMKMFEQPT